MAFSASTSHGTNAGSSITTLSVTSVTLAGEALLVYIQTEDGTAADGEISSVVYDPGGGGNEAALALVTDGSQAAQIQEPAGTGTANRGELWILHAADYPGDVSAKTVTVTPAGTTGVHMHVFELNAGGAVTVDQVVVNNDASSQYDITMTTTTDGGWLIGAIGTGGTSALTSLDTEISNRSDESMESSVSEKAAPSTAGSTTMSWTSGSNPRENQLMVHFIEGGAPPATHPVGPLGHPLRGALGGPI